METSTELKTTIGETGRETGLIDKSSIEQKKSQAAISRYVEQRLIAKNQSLAEKDEREVEFSLDDLSTAERATRIYEDVISCSLETRQANADKKVSIDPYLISELKLLWHDTEAKQLFLERYSSARIDAKTFRLSEMGRGLRQLEKQIATARSEYQKFKQDLNLRRVTDPTAVRATERRLLNRQKLLENLLTQEQRLVTLTGFEPTQENTDVAAIMMYETLVRYHREAKPEHGGFTWLPSRREIHKKAIEVIEDTGKSPLLIGPPGTGKTTQINAIAKELTGEDALRIPCHSGLSEEGLVANRDIKGGEGTYDYQGTIAEAFTGFLHSRDQSPALTKGRIVNLDEISQLNLDRALGPIKDIRQAKPGKPLSRYVPRPVLSGSFLTATSNIPITDERLDREFSQVRTNYFEMTEDNPELYEFMLAKLLNDEGHLSARMQRSELAPFYKKNDLPEDQRRTLASGDIVVVAMAELENDRANTRHGYLYRLAHAVRAAQDAYIEGSRYNEQHMAKTALYFNYDDKGDIYITDYLPDIEKSASSAGGGERLVLEMGSSTFTAEMIAYWMQGFRLNREKSLPNFIQKLLERHIDQTSLNDGEKLRVIFNYFHLFDQSHALRENIQPLIPKEIGYLSPRVPRPLYVEKPKREELVKQEGPKELKEYETIQVLLENGQRVLVAKRELHSHEIKEFAYDGGTMKGIDLVVPIGTQFKVKGEDFIFAGLIEDLNSPDHGKPIGQLVKANLYHVLTPQELDQGIFNYEFDVLTKDIDEKEQVVKDFGGFTQNG